MSRKIAAIYIEQNFQPSDRLAVVLLNKRTNSVIQRLASAEQMAEPDFQSWLARQNSRRYDVYLSMNALEPDAIGRTKRDIAAIRHVYLDFDVNGTSAIDALLKRDDLPAPNHLISTSPDKWQVTWKVDGFSKKEAEALQKHLARDTGADPAATDCARVLRLPGLYNHKYATPHLVRVEFLSRETFGQDQFPKFKIDKRNLLPSMRVHRAESPSPRITQSERDWGYARRALARGESPAAVIAAIATYRRYDKPNPQYYAELTVRKAQEAFRVESVHGEDTNVPSGVDRGSRA